MASVKHVLAEKSNEVITVSPDSTVLDAARLMNDHRIGCLIVIADGKLAGIFTERDLMLRIVVTQIDPASTTVAEVMTTPVACASLTTTLDELRSVMRDKRIRHIPVIGEGSVLGIISIGDLNRIDNMVQEQTISYLEQYMSVP